jgi:signal peptidase I
MSIPGSAAIREAAFLTAVTSVLFLLLQQFVVQPFGIQQRSMEHTLHSGDYVLVDKVTPRLGLLARGDIIVFHAAEQASDATPFVKRIIGLGGDVVELVAGIVVVNGVPLVEPYVYDREPTLAGATGSRILVPEGSLFVLGDHRLGSVDSRSPEVGLVPVERVIGRAWLRYWPPNAIAPIAAPPYAEAVAAGR